MDLTLLPTERILMMSLLAIAVPAPGLSQDPDQALHDWQVRRLMQPLPHELKKERSGSVYIYDGLTEREVETALDAHFNRIQYMMFVGTVKTDARGEPLHDNATGQVIQESGGCGSAE